MSRHRSFLSALLLGALLAWLAPPLAAQALPPGGDTLEVSLLTFGPGEIYWERFGHNALLVRDRADGSEVAYNYGIFDFEEDDFLLNFARGRMRYRIAADVVTDDFADYRAEGRWIVEQRLDLAPAERVALRDYLAWNARPENAYYRYDYFEANCSTRVRDALDHALGGALKRQTSGRSRGYTYRLDALRLMAPEPLLMALIDLGLGPYADRRLDYWQESFVPMSLMQAVREVRLGDGTDARPLVAAETRLAPARLADPPALPPDLQVPFLLAGVGGAAALLALHAQRRRRLARIAHATLAVALALACTIGGGVLAALWGLTDHVSAWRNENLLLLDPLALFLLPAWIGSARANWRPSRRACVLAWVVALIAGFALFSKILPWFVQANLHWIVLLLPLHAALAINAGRARAGR